MKLDQKITQANQAQPNVSNLMKETITLGHDTNALLETQSTPRPPPSDEPKTGKRFTVPEAELPATTWRPVHNHPIRQGRRSTRLEPRSIRIQRAAPVETSIQGRHNYGSIESNSSDEKAKYTTFNRYPNHTKRFQDIKFFGRRKDPYHGELLVVKQSSPAFDCLMNYWYDWLYNTTPISNADGSRKFWEQVKTLYAAFKNTMFSAKDSIMVFNFLSKFMEKANTLGVYKALAFLIVPKLLCGRENVIHDLSITVHAPPAASPAVRKLSINSFAPMRP